MPSPTDYRCRFTVEIREDQALMLQKMLPHGTKKLLFQSLVDGVIQLYTKGGFDAIGAIITGHISVVQLAEAGKSYTDQTLRATSEVGDKEGQ